MKNSFANLVLAGGVALGAGNAMAQSNPDNPDGYNTLTSSHTLTTTINGATAKVLTEESDTHLVPSSLQSEGVLSLESRKKLEKIMISVNDPYIAYDNMNRKNSQKSTKDSLSYPSLSVGLPHKVKVTDGSTHRSVGFDVDGASNMKYGTIGVASHVGDSATVSLTGAVAREDAGIALGNPDYAGKTLEGEQSTIALDVAEFGSFKNAGISLSIGKAHATELGTSSLTTTENRVLDTPTATEDWRDTYSTKTTTNYTGSTWNTVGVRGVLDVGTQGELSLRGGAYTNNIMGNKATGGIGYTHYMETSGKVEVNADIVGENKLYSAKYTKPLSEGWSLTAELSHIAGVVNDTRAIVGLVWTSGAKSSYTRPTAYDALDANKVVARNLSSAEHTLRGLGAYGKVETTTGPKTLIGSEKTGETEKQDRTPPIVTLNGLSTVTLTVGDTWSDPGITCNESCTTIITGNVDTNAPGTYTMFYQAKDKAGNASSVIKRTIVVKCSGNTTPGDGGICVPD